MDVIESGASVGAENLDKLKVVIRGAWGTLPLVSHSSWRARNVGTILLARANMSCGVRSGSVCAISNVRGAEGPGDENLPLWQLGYVAPNLPFVFVAHIAGLQRIRLRVHFNQQINDVLEGNIALVRAMPAPPTNVKPNAIFWNTLQSVI